MGNENYRSVFNIITKAQFYHSGGKIENRKSIVEALTCNFELNNGIKAHFNMKKKKRKTIVYF